MPFLIPYFLIKQREKLSQQDFKDRFGSAYNGLKTTHKAFMFYNGLYCLRRMLFCISIVILQKYTYLQVSFCLVAPTMLLSYIITTFPYTLNLINKIEIINEIAIIGAGYGFLCFSRFVLDPDAKFLMGKILMYFVCFNIFCNLLAIFSKPYDKIK